MLRSLVMATHEAHSCRCWFPDTRSYAFTVLIAFGLTIAGCAGAPKSTANPSTEPTFVETWGAMRLALREGRSEARVDLDGLAANCAIGVGALAGLGGEVTIADGRVHVATVDASDCVVFDAPPDAAATLLVRAEVDRWREHALPDCATYADLEIALAAVVERTGFDPSIPTPVRIRGRAAQLDYHVIAGSCPIADPAGTPPWRFSGALDNVELVGFFVEGAAGRLTHHDRRSHLHVLAPGHTGHLDDVSLADAVVLLPESSSVVVE